MEWGEGSKLQVGVTIGPGLFNILLNCGLFSCLQKTG